MKSAITLCQVTEAAAGPFVFHDPLPVGFAKAAALGYDAVELFLPGPHAVSVDDIKSLQAEHGLAIAAVGTGAGMVKHGLSLTDPDAGQRTKAIDFITSMIDFGGQLGAPAILGSMQGKWGGDISRDQALAWLAEALAVAAERAGRHNVSFIYEPLHAPERHLHRTPPPPRSQGNRRDRGRTVLGPSSHQRATPRLAQGNRGSQSSRPHRRKAL